MSHARISDALTRLTEHHDLHLPLRRGDVAGRLALRFLWLRELKWQMEVNLATRDAVAAVAELCRELHDELAAERQRRAELADKDDLRAAVDNLHGELDVLRRSDQTMMAGLNQRLYALIGTVRTELSDLRLKLAESDVADHDVQARIKQLESTVADLAAAETDARLRHAKLDLFLDQVPRERPAAEDISQPATAERADFIELAMTELLDGGSEQLRRRRGEYLPVVDAARARGATGAVFDLNPARGEWYQLLRDSGVEYRTASRNPLLVEHCARLGSDTTSTDPLDALAATPERSLGAVTAFRYVERLDVSSLGRFVDAAAASLQPGGILVVETPTAGRDFHLDPFAVRPVHPQLLRFLAEAAGFTDLEVRYPDTGPPDAWPPDLNAAAADTADRYCLLARR